MIRVIENSYPRYPGIPRAEPGDLCRWEAPRRGSDGMQLVRVSDGACVFVSPPPPRAGQWDQTHVIGTIAQVKSKSWRLVVAQEYE